MLRMHVLAQSGAVFAFAIHRLSTCPPGAYQVFSFAIAMPLPPAPVERQARHIRQVHYRSFERSDGLWDVEGELDRHQSCRYATPGWRHVSERAKPIHHMHIRVTIDTDLVVHAIERCDGCLPLQPCPGALGSHATHGRLQHGAWLAQGHRHPSAWCGRLRPYARAAAEHGDAAFQSISEAFKAVTTSPPGFWAAAQAGTATARRCCSFSRALSAMSYPSAVSTPRPALNPLYTPNDSSMPIPPPASNPAIFTPAFAYPMAHPDGRLAHFGAGGDRVPL